VTEVPAQTGLAEAAIVTPAATVPVILMVTVFDVAGLPDAHVAFDVKTQVI
jgi:hypothetical protein